METGWEEKYYLNQAGSGFAAFSGLRYQKGNGFSPYAGLRYQRGNGFLGRLWKGVTLPLLKYIGKQGIEAAGNIIQEVNSNQGNVKQIIAKEAKKMAGRAVEDGGKRLSTYIQTGKGVRSKGLAFTTKLTPHTNKRVKKYKKNNKASPVKKKSTKASKPAKQKTPVKRKTSRKPTKSFLSIK